MTTPSPSVPSGRAGSVGSFDRRIVVRVVLAVAVVCAACVVATLVLGPRDAGSGPAFERAFLGACTRGGGDTDACRCAFAAWTAAVPESERAGLDERLARGGALPAEVRESLSTC